uniref:Uncharacterized protein n=1 Tax=Rhizophora mucronata TaxID=61149 RepID=A0A2P2QVH6_RHIMU
MAASDPIQEMNCEFDRRLFGHRVRDHANISLRIPRFTNKNKPRRGQWPHYIK